MSVPEELFLAEQHPVSRRHAVLEDDGRSAWLYLTAPDEQRPVADCWLYNRVPPPSLEEVRTYEGGPPPAAEGYAGPEALRSPPAEETVRFLWSPDGHSLAVSAAGELLGFIAAGQRQGYSRHLAREGPWGHPLDMVLYAKLFERE